MTEWICFLNKLSFGSADYPDFVCLRRDTILQRIKNDYLAKLCGGWRLSTFSKIFEKCVYKRVYSFLGKYNLTFKRQFGFRLGYCFNHTTADLVESIKKYIDNDNYVCSIFIDL